MIFNGQYVTLMVYKWAKMLRDQVVSINKGVCFFFPIYNKPSGMHLLYWLHPYHD